MTSCEPQARIDAGGVQCRTVSEVSSQTRACIACFRQHRQPPGNPSRWIVCCEVVDILKRATRVQYVDELRVSRKHRTPTGRPIIRRVISRPADCLLHDLPLLKSGRTSASWHRFMVPKVPIRFLLRLNTRSPQYTNLGHPPLETSRLKGVPVKASQTVNGPRP